MAFKTNRKKAVARPRRKPYAKKKGLVRMIKQVAMRTEETKRYTYTGTLRPVNNNLYYYNLMYNLSQGVTDNQFIGDKVRVMGVSVDWHFAGDRYVSGGNNIGQDCFAQMTLIQSRKELYNVINPQVFNVATQTDFLVNGGSWGMLTRYDRNKCKVIRKKEMMYKGNDRVTPPTGTGSLWVPINRDFQFTTGSSGIGRFSNYYVMAQFTNIYSYNETSGSFFQTGATDLGQVDYSVTMYYKDS